jgi:hypothetical protein
VQYDRQVGKGVVAVTVGPLSSVSIASVTGVNLLPSNSRNPGTRISGYAHIRLPSPANAFSTILVHNGVMAAKEKTVRQSLTLPGKVATQVRSMAKRRRLSANRMLIELVEEGLEAKQQKEKAFYELAERFRAASDPKEVERLGEELGQMVFGK